MLIEEFVLTNKLGLHVRAASKLVGETANAKSILHVMLLAATIGCSLSIVIEGDDENEAMSALRTLFESNFGEEE